MEIMYYANHYVMTWINLQISLRTLFLAALVSSQYADLFSRIPQSKSRREDFGFTNMNSWMSMSSPFKANPAFSPAPGQQQSSSRRSTSEVKVNSPIPASDHFLPLADHAGGGTMADNPFSISDWALPPIMIDTHVYREEPRNEPDVQTLADGKSMAMAILRGRNRAWQWRHVLENMTPSKIGYRDHFFGVACCQRLPYICGVDGLCVIESDNCQAFCECAANPHAIHCLKTVPRLKKTVRELQKKVIAEVAEERSIAIPDEVEDFLTRPDESDVATDGKTKALAIHDGMGKSWSWENVLDTLAASSTSYGDNFYGMECCQSLPYICGVDGMCLIETDDCEEFCECAFNPDATHCIKTIPYLRRTLRELEKRAIVQVAREHKITISAEVEEILTRAMDTPTTTISTSTSLLTTVTPTTTTSTSNHPTITSTTTTTTTTTHPTTTTVTMTTKSTTTIPSTLPTARQLTTSTLAVPQISQRINTLRSTSSFTTVTIPTTTPPRKTIILTKSNDPSKKPNSPSHSTSTSKTTPSSSTSMMPPLDRNISTASLHMAPPTKTPITTPMPMTTTEAPSLTSKHPTTNTAASTTARLLSEPIPSITASTLNSVTTTDTARHIYRPNQVLSTLSPVTKNVPSSTTLNNQSESSTLHSPAPITLSIPHESSTKPRRTLYRSSTHRHQSSILSTLPDFSTTNLPSTSLIPQRNQQSLSFTINTPTSKLPPTVRQKTPIMLNPLKGLIKSRTHRSITTTPRTITIRNTTLVGLQQRTRAEDGTLPTNAHVPPKSTAISSTDQQKEIVKSLTTSSRSITTLHLLTNIINTTLTASELQGTIFSRGTLSTTPPSSTTKSNSTPISKLRGTSTYSEWLQQTRSLLSSDFPLLLGEPTRTTTTSSSSSLPSSSISLSSSSPSSSSSIPTLKHPSTTSPVSLLQSQRATSAIHTPREKTNNKTWVIRDHHHGDTETTRNASDLSCDGCEENGGVCVMGNDFSAHCIKTLSEDACEQFRCVHGSCLSTDGFYSCECFDGWTGTFCDMECPLHCGSNGFCVQLDVSKPVACVCHWNYTGEMCDQERTIIPTITEMSVPGDEFQLWEVAIIAVVTAVLLASFCVLLPYYLWRRQWLPIRKLVFYFRDYENDDGKEYDAFISYRSCPRDERFVLHHLYPKLEKELDFRLCLHFRDFPPGQPIANNIIYAIEHSRRTIMVLSPSYVKSEWCRMEYQKAQHEMLRLRHKIIPIILEDIDGIPEMDKNLKTIIDTVTYIKWPGEVELSLSKRIVNFWKLLEMSMPKKRPEYDQSLSSTGSSSSVRPFTGSSKTCFNSIVDSLSTLDEMSNKSSSSDHSKSGLFQTNALDIRVDQLKQTSQPKPFYKNAQLHSFAAQVEYPIKTDLNHISWMSACDQKWSPCDDSAYLGSDDTKSYVNASSCHDSDKDSSRSAPKFPPSSFAKNFCAKNYMSSDKEDYQYLDKILRDTHVLHEKTFFVHNENYTVQIKSVEDNGK